MSDNENHASTTAPEEADTTICPFCREKIKAGSIKCRHCQSLLVPLNENSKQQAPTIQQSVQVVTPTTSTPQTRLVVPTVVVEDRLYGIVLWGDKMYGHGIVQIFLSILIVGFAKDEEKSAALISTLSFAAPLLFYIYWVLSKETASKIMPAIAGFFTIMAIAAAFAHQ